MSPAAKLERQDVIFNITIHFLMHLYNVYDTHIYISNDYLQVEEYYIEFIIIIGLTLVWMDGGEWVVLHISYVVHALGLHACLLLKGGVESDLYVEYGQ